MKLLESSVTPQSGTTHNDVQVVACVTELRQLASLGGEPRHVLESFWIAG